MSDNDKTACMCWCGEPCPMHPKPQSPTPEAQPAMPTKEAALLPCPFCGGEGTIHEGEQIFWAGCLDCNLDLNHCDSREAAIAAWNTRAQSTPPEQRATQIIANMRSHKWTTVRAGGNPAVADSYEMVRYCEVCGIEDSCEDDLPPCEAAHPEAVRMPIEPSVDSWRQAHASTKHLESKDAAALRVECRELAAWNFEYIAQLQTEGAAHERTRAERDDWERLYRESEAERAEVHEAKSKAEAELESLRKENAELKLHAPRWIEQEKGSTHWDDCYLDHRNCALRLIESLRSELATAQERHRMCEKMRQALLKMRPDEWE